MNDKFPIFISWAKPRALAIARGLFDWLPDVIQSIEPFISPEIPLGTRWTDEIENRLRTAKYGIICATPENVDNPYLNWEVGLLAYDRTRKVVPLLLGGLTLGDITKSPLQHFQSSLKPSREDMLRCVEGINEIAGLPVDQERLKKNFERYWPDLNNVFSTFNTLPKESGATKPRRDSEILEDLLVRMGQLENSIERLSQGRPGARPSHQRLLEAIIATDGDLRLAARMSGAPSFLLRQCAERLLASNPDELRNIEQSALSAVLDWRDREAARTEKVIESREDAAERAAADTERKA